MSGFWNRTLVYLGLREEPEESHDQATGRFDAADDAPVVEAQDSAAGSAGMAISGRAGDDQRRRPAAFEDRPGRGSAERGRLESGRGTRDEAADGTAGSNVRPLRGPSGAHVRAVQASPLVRAAVIELLVFDDVEAVGARYRTGQPVIFDVTGADRATARRMVDFVAGLTFALRGRLTKVGAGAFLLTPDGVELPANERRRLTDLGYRLPVASDD